MFYKNKINYKEAFYLEQLYKLGITPDKAKGLNSKELLYILTIERAKRD